VILVDTSAWIAFFRGEQPVADEVDALILDNQVALCGPILTELVRGLRTNERRSVLPLLEGCELLSQPADLWTEAGELGAVLRKRGAAVKTLDLLIAAYALAHSAPLLSLDADFVTMQKVGVPLHLVH
jgi:predicted nucleic acid-binding protein